MLEGLGEAAGVNERSIHFQNMSYCSGASQDGG